MSEFEVLSSQRTTEEMLQLMSWLVADWLNDHKEQIAALEKVYNETCTMDQLGFIHDKATGEIIAGSKLDWFNTMLGEK